MKTLFDHLGLKVIALLIAAGFWVAVSSDRSERQLERPYDVPVVLGAIPQHLLVTANDHDSVRVRLRGRQSTLSAISSQTLEATIDLSDAHAGEVTAIIRPQALNLPVSGVEVVSIDPPKIIFKLEQKRQKVVPIRPFLVGDAPAGMAVGKVTSDPANALVSGPASVIRDFSEVSTERVLLGTSSKNFVVSVGVVSDRALVRVIEPANCRVSVELNPLEAEVPDVTTATAPTSTSLDESKRIDRPTERPGGRKMNETTVRH